MTTAISRKLNPRSRLVWSAAVWTIVVVSGGCISGRRVPEKPSMRAWLVIGISLFDTSCATTPAGTIVRESCQPSGSKPYLIQATDDMLGNGAHARTAVTLRAVDFNFQ